MRWSRYAWGGEFKLEQNGLDVTGTWKVPAVAWRGTVNGRLTGPLNSGQTFTGTITVDAAETKYDPACAETATLIWGRLDSTQTWLTLQAYFTKCAEPIDAFTFELDRRCSFSEDTGFACILPTPPPPPPDAPRFTLSGRVVDDRFQPLNGARVEVMSGPDQGKFVVTGDTGEYALSEVVQGQWVFRASKVGYMSDGRTINLVRDQSLQFALPPCERGLCLPSNANLGVSIAPRALFRNK